MTTIREPSQKRSIETKRKIIEAGYNLFAKYGYYKINTAQIAKEAGVSTGIVYGYFNNKKDILKEVISDYIKKTYNQIFDLLDKIKRDEDIVFLINHILNLAEEIHKENCDIHRELSAVSQADEDISSTFINLEDEVTIRFVEQLNFQGYKNVNSENIHLAMNIIESYVHEAVYDKHSYIDYSKLKEQVIKIIKFMFD